MRKKSNYTAEESALRQLLAGRGLQWLAAQTGISYTAMKTHSSRGFNDSVIRARIENVLGAPVWADAHTFRRRRHCQAALGFDPYELRSEDLQARAQTLPLRSRPAATTALAEELLNFAATRPNLAPPMNPPSKKASTAVDAYRAITDSIGEEQAHIETSKSKIISEADELQSISEAGNAEDEVAVSRATVLAIKRPMREKEIIRRQARVEELLGECSAQQRAIRAELDPKLDRVERELADFADAIIPDFFTDHVFCEIYGAEQVDKRRGLTVKQLAERSDFGLRIMALRVNAPNSHLADAGAARAVLVWANGVARVVEDWERFVAKHLKNAA